jgi:hypothetical protein
MTTEALIDMSTRQADLKVRLCCTRERDYRADAVRAAVSGISVTTV